MAIVRADHPRIWITKDTLPALKAKAAANDPRWLALKAVGDRPADWGNGIIAPALCYLITGNAAYASKSWSLMSASMASGISQITPDSGLQAHNYLPASAICFDWLHDWLQPAQLAALKADIEACSDWVWPETNPLRKGMWGVDADMSGNNYHHSFMLTWMTGLALAGESVKAQGYLDNARRRWDTEIVPYLTTIAAGGLLAEGMAYGVASMGWMLWYLLAHSAATGEDLIGGTPWFGDVANAMLHMTNPALREMVPLGDLAAGPVTDRVRRVMLCLSSHYPQCAGWLDAVTPNRNQEPLNQWEEFLWYAPAAVVPPAPSPFMIAPGIGAVSSRTGWSQTDTQLIAVCGPTLESHQDRAQGEFLIAAGADWLAGQAKMVAHSGLSQATLDHSCVTCDSLQQTWTQDTCRYLAQEDTPQYTYLKMDLAGAYQGMLAGYTREIMWLKPGLLLIRDLPVKINPLSRLQWNLQTLTPPVLDPFGFAVTAPGGTKLFGTAAASAFSFAPVQADANSGISYRLMLPPASDDTFVVALEIAPAARATRTITVLTPPGLQGAVRGNTLAAAVTGALPLTYSSPVNGMHYLLGLQPTTVYQGPGGPLTSSAAGVLAFIGSAVGQPVTISKGGTPPPPPPPPRGRTFNLFIPASGPVVVTEVPGGS